jgi:hypothetical protein
VTVQLKTLQIEGFFLFRKFPTAFQPFNRLLNAKLDESGPSAEKTDGKAGSAVRMIRSAEGSSRSEVLQWASDTVVAAAERAAGSFFRGPCDDRYGGYPTGYPPIDEGAEILIGGHGA